LYYLASIPRSGSTLLASLLSQRKDTYVSPTSNLADILGAVVKEFEDNYATKASQCTKEDLYRTLAGIVKAKYMDRKEPVVFDKGRGWPEPNILNTMTKITGETPKIVATVRPMVECMASMFYISKGTKIKSWVKDSELMRHMMYSYEALKAGYKKHPEFFCLVEYDDLCNDPQKELDRVADFLGLEHVTYNPHIEQVEEMITLGGLMTYINLLLSLEEQMK